MSGYGLGKGGKRAPTAVDDTIDLTGIARTPVPADPQREEAAVESGFGRW